MSDDSVGCSDKKHFFGYLEIDFHFVVKPRGFYYLPNGTEVYTRNITKTKPKCCEMSEKQCESFSAPNLEKRASSPKKAASPTLLQTAIKLPTLLLRRTFRSRVRRLDLYMLTIIWDTVADACVVADEFER